MAALNGPGGVAPALPGGAPLAYLPPWAFLTNDAPAKRGYTQSLAGCAGRTAGRVHPRWAGTVATPTAAAEGTVAYPTPMPQYRVQITGRGTGGIPQDDVVNTFYLDTDLDPITWGSDPDGLLRDAVDLWRAADLDLGERWHWVSGKAYNMADPEPREPVASVSWLECLGVRSTNGPAEVALCLSYYADRNFPRNRGRMYFGPWGNGGMFSRPPAQAQEALATLAEGLSGLGGVNTQWVQHSPRDARFSNVTDYWIDDAWDTQRRRGLKATSRLAGTVSG